MLNELDRFLEKQGIRFVRYADDFSLYFKTKASAKQKGKIRKYTKNKLSFSNDDAVIKSVYLALDQITKKWTQPIQNRGLILNQFLTIFEKRVQI